MKWRSGAIRLGILAYAGLQTASGWAQAAPGPAAAPAADGGGRDDDAGVAADAPLEQSPASDFASAATPSTDGDMTAEYGASAVAPGPFVRVTVDELPRNVQQVEGAALSDHDGVGLHSALSARLGSASINDVQNNPLQPDFQYRGFTASPLLGTPQGLAVYQNGVRVNEPFGDVLQWDLIPTFALAEASLVPGADPIYGLNALGGSLVLQMKDGFRAPGVRVEALGGSFSRYLTTAEYGHAWGEWALYAGASVFGEQGWRDHSPSSAQNLYLDVRHRKPGREVGVSMTAANTSLFGNGPAPKEQLAADPNAVYTYPDITRNQLFMLSLDAKQRLDDTSALLATLYLRHDQRNTLNGDAAEFALCSRADGQSILCGEDGEPLLDESGVEFETDEPYNAVFNTTQTVSDAFGGTLQFDSRAHVASKPNHFVGGLSYDGSHSGFLQRTELGRLTLDRGVQAGGLDLSGGEYRTELEVQNHALGVFVTDTWRVFSPLALQVSARLNLFDTQLEDQQGSALDGHHTFVRVNPSAGVIYSVAEGWALFASYGESNRAPSAAELACADPDEPCRVPNAFISDPPLEHVVSRSVELGVRTRIGERARPWLRGSLAAFGTRNQDDILFVAGSRVGTGYFRNAGTTQRIGLEVSIAADTKPVSAYASYTLLRATFEDDLELPGTANPAASGGGDDDEGGSLEVEKGSRIPGLPTHAVKAGVAVRPIAPLELGVSMVGQSSQPFRGDEGNFLDGVHGFVVLSAHASYQLFEPLKLYVRATNLLDTKYSTFGVLADPAEVLPGTSNPRFLGRGAPFGIWVGAVVTEVP
jgi:outer membrane receptor protein involved in Fe transport